MICYCSRGAMSANLSPEYLAAEEEHRSAGTAAEKIAALEKMLATMKTLIAALAVCGSVGLSSAAESSPVVGISWESVVRVSNTNPSLQAGVDRKSVVEGESAKCR